MVCAVIEAPAAVRIGKIDAAITSGSSTHSREYPPCRDFMTASLVITSTHRQGHKVIEPEIA
jgi:hypothetical protein